MIASEWQPIETAPQGRILVCGPAFILCWDEKQRPMAVECGTTFAVAQTWPYCDGLPPAMHPTHWMPLPAPPPEHKLPQGAVSVLNPQGTEETGADRPTAPSLMPKQDV